MSKQKSKATKPALKNIKKGKKKKGPGRGGARPGAGRKPKFGESQQISIDAPIEVIEAMHNAGINNKTAYITFLISKDLVNQSTKLSSMTKLKKIIEDLQDNYY